MGEDTKKYKNREILLTLKKEEAEKELLAFKTKSAADVEATLRRHQAEIGSKDATIAQMRAEKSDLEEELLAHTMELEEAKAKCSLEAERRSQLVGSLEETEKKLSDGETCVP